MAKLITYTSGGTKKSAGVNLPKEFVGKDNPALLAQAIRVHENRSHPGLSKTKTRSEIALTTKKAYRQKGTGMARHGAKSAPIFVGGSKAHGPKGIKKQLSMPKKMRNKALGVALGLKFKENKIVVVDGVNKIKKTKEAADLLNKIGEKEFKDNKRVRFTVCLSAENDGARMFFRNIENVELLSFESLNAYEVFNGGIIIVDADALKKKTGAKAQKEIKNTKKSNTKTQSRRKKAKK